MWGALAGTSDLTSVHDIYRVRLKDGPRDDLVVLRNLSRGIIAREPVENRIAFYRWEDITKFDYLVAPEDKRPLVCVWFGWRCPEVAAAET
jgi:hypothetical protein